MTNLAIAKQKPNKQIDGENHSNKNSKIFNYLNKSPKNSKIKTSRQ